MCPSFIACSHLNLNFSHYYSSCAWPNAKYLHVFPLFVLMLIQGKVPTHVPTIYGQHFFIVQISLYHVLVGYLNIIVQSGHNRSTEHVPTQFPILVRMISFSRQVLKSINFKLLMVHSYLMLSQC